jgi:membrane protein implicated in regulation of membrane protease activity
MTWWGWLILGFALMAAEIVSMGLVLLFLGVSAVIVGILSWAGIAGPAWMEWLLFSIMSLVSVAFFRKPLLRKLRLNEKREIDTMVGEQARAIEDIPANGQGKVELRGTVWTAKNVGVQPILRGQPSRVERVDGITLFVSAS